MRDKGLASVTLASIAADADVTRQTVYMYFGSRAGFLSALVEYVNQKAGLSDRAERLSHAPTIESALRMLVAIRVDMAPKLYPLIQELNAAVISDPDAAAAYKARQLQRLRPLLALARRMKDERRLRKGITPDTAAAMMWTTLSFETWNYLVPTLGWSTRKYLREMFAVLSNALLTATGRQSR